MYLGMPWWMWLLAAVTTIILISIILGALSEASEKGLLFVQSRDLQRFTSTIDEVTKSIPGIISDETIPRIIAAFPLALREEVAQLTAERDALRKDRDWTMVSVILHGIKGKITSDGVCRALVEVNLKTGQLRAAPESHRFYSDCGAEWWANYRAPYQVPKMDLGAPTYRKLENSEQPPILMLDAVYKYQ